MEVSALFSIYMVTSIKSRPVILLVFCFIERWKVRLFPCIETTKTCRPAWSGGFSYRISHERYKL